jgi:hypothetical protein
MLFANREKEPDLWPDAGHTSLEIAELCAGAAVAGELLKEIPGKPDLHILAHELRILPELTPSPKSVPIESSRGILRARHPTSAA